MTVNDWIQDATKQLTTAGIETARLDALVLLGDILNKNSAQLLAAPEQLLSTPQQQRSKVALERRIKHQPVAYIRQKCEFYGREFIVSPDVLIPRPETETMITLAKDLPAKDRRAFVDVGTGSGAIAITLACELHEVQVLATDISQPAVVVARQNCQKHQATVDLKVADLINGISLPDGATILANLPYVPDDYSINQAARNEPALALFGGKDGLDLYRKLFKQLAATGHKGTVLTEALPFQQAELAKLAANNNYKLIKTEDFIQVFAN